MGLTVLDAGVVIGILDERDSHHRSSRDALATVRRRGDSILLPASAYAEAMVGPARRGTDSIEVVDSFLARVPIRVEPVVAAIGARAASLRAVLGKDLLLPDALVVATALVLRADRLITTDRRWPSPAKLGLAKRLVVL